ncbi:MAG: SagB/ThcOx family dehydrogenase [Bacteroidaceae bacterium]|jgi:SagB-type dehydrogenase family enzyme|nr:SagB/ThcOx family dehydrogenase [Bacteroidaceae bacterium]
MKKMMMLAFTLVLGINAMAQEVKLPAPDKKVSTTLFEALQNRKSVRDFTAKELTEAQLSNLLWATIGVNREDGRMVAPTAMNRQEVSVYVATKDGTCLYNPKAHSLTVVSKEDIRPALTGQQKSVANAPIFLVIVSDASKFGNGNGYAELDAGYVSQNICLAAAAMGLGTVPRAMMDRDAVKKALNLGERQLVVLNHPVGYPNE